MPRKDGYVAVDTTDNWLAEGQLATRCLPRSVRTSGWSTVWRTVLQTIGRRSGQLVGLSKVAIEGQRPAACTVGANPPPPSPCNFNRWY